MAAQNHWLEVRSRNPGLEGPYIQEYHKAYQLIDEHGSSKIDVVLAVGAAASERCFALQPYPTRQTVSLHRTTSTNASRPRILLNCQLPLRCELSRIPDAVDHGHHSLHHLKGVFHHAPQISTSLYIEVLAPLSSVVLLFVADFGPISRIVDFLWAWLRSAMLKPPPFCPEIILVAERDSQLDMNAILSRLVSSGLSNLRVSDPNHAYSEGDIEKIRDAFLHLSIVPEPSLKQYLPPALQRTYSRRSALSLDFSAIHWKALTRAALSLYAEQPTVAINFPRLARLRKPVPHDLKTHITEFVQSTKSDKIDHAKFIASALVLDAFPPGMHSKSS